MSYSPVEIIIKKRNGEQLSESELKFMFQGYIENQIPDYQMSALLMAIYHKGMKKSEISNLTSIYINSGRIITFPEDIATVDKHSTGGVGDKISIILGPIMAACGAYVPMISGRGLGHTGGTLDKLDSIPGLRTDFSEKEFRKLVLNNGYAIVSQTESLVPIDKHIYALRDVTGTIESLPLITASIMSKKIAEGARNLVIDLKIGSGAFIRNLEAARKLGKLLTNTGNSFGQNVKIIYTNMNSPLGEYVGNSLEILESIHFLQGKKIPDLYQITRRLAITMLQIAGISSSETVAVEHFDNVLNSGAALERFKLMIQAQEGDPAVCDNPQLLPRARYEIPIEATDSGWIEAIDSQNIGYALIGLGAGRRKINDQLDYSAGAYLPHKIGDHLERGARLGSIFCNNLHLVDEAAGKIADSFHLTKQPTKHQELILEY
ncbi:MAG: thymidine phosphorylase [Candidatus Cloacimonetes bacterium]|nr:thymidine phosphorylase [Candidatus Cloacimonadota bacterium]